MQPSKGWVPSPDALNHGSTISPSEIKGIGSTTVEHIVEYSTPYWCCFFLLLLVVFVCIYPCNYVLLFFNVFFMSSWFFQAFSIPALCQPLLTVTNCHHKTGFGWIWVLMCHPWIFLARVWPNRTFPQRSFPGSRSCGTFSLYSMVMVHSSATAVGFSSNCP